MKLKIITASLHDLKWMADWSMEEAWNPGLHDYIAIALTDLNGFFVGYLEGQPIACISNLIYPNQFAFLGFYIVKPDYRGKGYGYQIWQPAMQYAKNCNIALDGVIAQQDNYKKSGFQLAHRNIRFVYHKNKIENFKDSYLKAASSISLSAIVNYNRKFFPGPRDAFVVDWLSRYQGLVYEKNGIQGYGVIRPARNGFRIGPLFAENEEIAYKLFQGLCSCAPKDASIYLDIPEINKHAFSLAQQFSMEPVFETARMYTKQIPDIAILKTFGITTFEIG